MTNYNDFKEAGISEVFVQDNQSASKKGVLRGLHFQKEFPQGKLVRVVKGSVFDVAVDLREGSATFGQWYGVLLSEENKKQFFIPKGFAHGFLVLSDVAEFCYKVTDFYHPGDEGGLAWNDPEIGIEWEHGVYLSSKPSRIDFQGIREDYGGTKMEKDREDIRLEQEDYFTQLHKLANNPHCSEDIRELLSEIMRAEFCTDKVDKFHQNLSAGIYDEDKKETSIDFIDIDTYS